MNLFMSGEFKLHSSVSNWKIECNVLCPEDWKTLALLVVERVRPFGSVEGVPTGGLLLAEALKSHATTGGLLIVDDVLTTGNSMNDWRGVRSAQGAVVFARNPSQVPDWVVPLFILGEKRGSN